MKPSTDRASAQSSNQPIERAIDYGNCTVFPSEVIFESGHLSEAKATVCVTLYNYENYILDALHSAYDQTLDELGLVVLDDCSGDFGLRRVERWLGEYSERFAGTCLLHHPINRGLGIARNGAVARAESDFIMILDADNELQPRCVERLVSGIEGTDFGFAYCILERFGEHTGLMGTLNWDPELLRTDNYIDAMALIKKDLWEAVGGYTPMAVSGWEDFDFWCKCAELRIRGHMVPEILARYRVHGSSMLRTETDRPEGNSRLRAEMMERHPWLSLIHGG